MDQQADNSALQSLAALIGEWRLEADMPGAPPGDVGARAVFEWMPGEHFLVQRWEIPVPEAPDGIAIIGVDPGGDGYLQHYFDSRGVALLYQMSLADGVWKLWRESEDFSPLSFSQRFTGTFSDDGNSIAGSWELSNDGSNWERDFGLTYTRLR